MTKNWWKWALGVFGVLIVVSILLDDPEQDATAEPKRSTKVSLEIDSTPAVVKAESVTVAGVVRPARAVVEVEIDDSGVEVADVGSDGSFALEVDLGEVGKHAVVTSARVGRTRAASVRTVVERRLSAKEIAARQERVRKRRAAAARERERREVARAEREAAKQAAAEERAAQEAAEAEPEPEPVSDCDPNYSECVPIASDVDCAGGSGDGPAYTGPVTVTGSDIYDLDSDSDGTACE